MPYVYGLSGAHRTGKTTLMHKMRWSAVLDFSVSEVAKDFIGDTDTTHLTDAGRMRLQELLLATWTHAVFKACKDYSADIICDRNPLDFAAYALLAKQTSNPRLSTEWLDSYVAQCMQVLNQYMRGIIIIPPGIPFKPDIKSYEESSVDTLHEIYLSLAMTGLVKIPLQIMPADLTDLHDRVAYTSNKFNEFRWKT